MTMAAGILTQMTISFQVHGIPKTEGSIRAVVHKATGRAVAFHDDDRELRMWRQAVAAEALIARRGGEPFNEGPITLSVRFRLPIPKSRPAELRTEKQRLEWAWPAKRPDADKLLRAILDALKGVLYHDDGQIVRLEAIKRYHPQPGATILVERMRTDTDTGEA